ncbi:SCO2400 family protein, partial [Kitasatospora indigofera]
MDYCASCRRHLNGALSCPGCGAAAATATAPPPGPARPTAAETPTELLPAVPPAPRA